MNRESVWQALVKFVLYLSCEKNENETGFGPFKKYILCDENIVIGFTAACLRLLLLSSRGIDDNNSKTSWLLNSQFLEQTCFYFGQKLRS